MKKIILIAIKIIPLFTLYKAFFGGQNKLESIMNIGKSMFTQYEAQKMMGIIVRHYKENQGDLIQQPRFKNFINSNFADQYSVQVRNFFSLDTEDFSTDIWSGSYKVHLDTEAEYYNFVSPGPDSVSDTKDDIRMGFKIKGISRTIGRKPEINEDIELTKPEVNSSEINNTEDRYFDDNGFDNEGYSREGFDQEGFNRDGFDKEGFDRDGYDINGNHKDDGSF